MAEISFSSRTKGIIALVLAGMAVLVLVKAGHVVIPFLWAAVAAYIFNPVVSHLSLWTRTNRLLWVFFLYVVLGLVGTWAVLVLLPVVNQQLTQLAGELPGFLDSAATYFGAQASIDIFGFSVQTQTLNEQITKWLADLANSMSRGAFGLLVHVAETIISVIVFLFATFYLLLDGPRLIAFLQDQAPAKYRAELNCLLIRINRVLAAFIRGQILLVIIMSTATYIVLSVLQVRFALVLALATGVLELIPFIGPYAAGGMAVSVAFFQPLAPYGWSHLLLAAMVALSYFILRELEDNLVIPSVIGSLVELHPLIVIFVVLAGAAFGGITGLFLAVPTAAVIKILISFVYPKLVQREPREKVWVSPSDTVGSALEKVGEAATNRVVLMLSPEAKLLAEKGGLRSLRDGARRARVDLTISCPTDEICYRAEKVGLKTTYEHHHHDVSPVQPSDVPSSTTTPGARPASS